MPVAANRNARAELARHRELKQLEADARRGPRLSVPQLVGLDRDYQAGARRSSHE